MWNGLQGCIYVPSGCLLSPPSALFSLSLCAQCVGCPVDLVERPHVPPPGQRRCGRALRLVINVTIELDSCKLL